MARFGKSRYALENVARFGKSRYAAGSLWLSVGANNFIDLKLIANRWLSGDWLSGNVGDVPTVTMVSRNPARFLHISRF